MRGSIIGGLRVRPPIPPPHVLLALALLSSGCDKLKGAMSKGGDAGQEGATSGGGILSFLGTDFEGEITANLTSKNSSLKGHNTLVFGIHKPKYRVDMSSTAVTNNAPFGAGSMILDPKEKKGWMLVPGQKMAMVLEFDKMKALSAKGQVPGVTTPKTPPKIEKTGKKDVVAGYSCDIWNITADNKKAEACVAEGITWLDLGDLGLASPEVTLAAIASEANRFPLRAITYDAKGVEETRMEVTKVDKKKLDDARFVVPPDYRVVDMATMVGGLGHLSGIPSAIPAAPKR